MTRGVELCADCASMGGVRFEPAPSRNFAACRLFLGPGCTAQCSPRGCPMLTATLKSPADLRERKGMHAEATTLCRRTRAVNRWNGCRNLSGHSCRPYRPCQLRLPTKQIRFLSSVGCERGTEPPFTRLQSMTSPYGVAARSWGIPGPSGIG